MNLAQSTLLSLTTWFLLLPIADPVAASETHYLIRNKTFCSSNEEICIRGTLSYEINPRLLRLRGRVQSTTGPGLLRIRLIGMNRLEHRHTAEMELSLRGNHSEIINYKLIPDHPDVADWEVISISYELESADNYQGAFVAICRTVHNDAQLSPVYLPKISSDWDDPPCPRGPPALTNHGSLQCSA